MTAASPSLSFLARDEAATELLGAALGAALERGGIVALVGQLGAGKTRLAQSVASALGVDRREVSSPTFVLIQEYEGRVPIFHCDTYRLRNVREFLDLGADELFEPGSVCLIEWADRVESELPSDHLRIEITVAGPTAREFTLSARGPTSSAVLESVRSRLQSAGADIGERPTSAGR